MKDRFERFVRTFLGFIAGICIGNVLWVIPSTAYWGGALNVFACFALPVGAVALWWISMEADE